MDHDHEHYHKPKKSGGLFSFNGLLVTVILLSIGYILIIDHREHLGQILPWFILLLCPLMHVFMHGSHGHGGHGDKEE